MYEYLGTTTQKEVHEKGLWHGGNYIQLQLRSESKKDFPSVLDVSAAGDILSHESVGDGIRELEEELGLSIRLTDLEKVGLSMKKYFLRGVRA